MAIFKPDFTGKTVLIVEDNETSSFYFEAALKKLNATTIWAKNGKEAVELFRENEQINLVLMDLNMPEMDGFEATKMIKKIRPQVPVIVQSAYILSGEENRSFEAGGDEFLAKPIRLNMLVDTITRFLK
jgi:hypothetical protein